MDSFDNVAFIPIFLASLIGSPHCAGMCGGFVGIYSHNAKHRVYPHILYSLGRLTTYLLLGTVAAYFGRTLDSLAPIAKISSLVVGVSLVLSGLIHLFFGKISLLTGLSERVGKFVQIFAKPVFRSPSVLKPFAIGLVTTFLPCGWLYTFVALALASADPLVAAVIMFVFWLGTLPVMVSLGFASRWLTSKAGRFLPKIVALLLIFGGLLSIHFHLKHAQHNHHLASPEHSSHH